jgi:hypothetical protein
MDSSSYALSQSVTVSGMQGGEGENLWGVSQGSCSFIEGKNNIAFGECTHAAGIGNIACVPY